MSTQACKLATLFVDLITLTHWNLRLQSTVKQPQGLPDAGKGSEESLSAQVGIVPVVVVLGAFEVVLLFELVVVVVVVALDVFVVI